MFVGATTLRIASVGLVGTMLLCAARLPAQETTQKHGTVKGTVSLVNASQERSTPEGLLLELKPLTEGRASLSAVTDEAGNYEFKDVADGDYILQLQTEGIEPFTATLRVRDGMSIVQNISAKMTEVTQKIKVHERIKPLSTTSDSTAS